MKDSIRNTPDVGKTGRSSDGSDDQMSWLSRSAAPCPVENLEIRRLSEYEWRVGDNRCPERSPEKVLGYIGQCGSSYGSAQCASAPGMSSAINSSLRAHRLPGDLCGGWFGITILKGAGHRTRLKGTNCTSPQEGMDSEKPPLANADEAADGTTATNSSADTDRDTDTDTDTDTDIVQHLPVGKEDSERHVALVVEDDAKGAKVLRILLEAEGFRVLVATNGEQGLEIASMQHLSLITLDIRLPRMDGWGFLIRLREYVDLAPVPIVIVAGEADISRALTHGAAAVLEKPISRAACNNPSTL